MTKLLTAASVVLFALPSYSAFADVAGYSISIMPSAPVSLEPVYAKVANTQLCAIDPAKTTMSQDGMTIIVVVRPKDNCLPVGSTVTQDLSLGQFHSGQFSVVVRDAQGQQLTSGQFRVAESGAPRSTPAAMVNYTDLWWNPQESGWGISLTHHASGRLFAVWFTYDDAGMPVWFTLQPGQWTSVTTYTGPIYRTSGPSFAAPFDPSRVAVSQVGTGTLTFHDSSSATFSYTAGGVSSERRIERMVF
jgi:hypothetical protein